jgi:hypothetical protein
LDSDGQPEATKALVVIGVGINGFWRLPLAYYLTDGTNSDLQESILSMIISKLWEVGCVAVSITLDGLAANQKTVQKLGCTLDPDNLVSTFPHPECSDISVAVIFDPCHMLKLARNALNEYQIITVPNVGKAKWQHIEMLHSKQSDEGLTLANKVTKAHINFKRQKMKVRLAVQVFSASTARALEYLRLSGSREFTDSQATEVLVSTLDKLFDILNSRSRHGKGYKAAIGYSNAFSRLAFLRSTKDFLLNLQDSTGRKLVHTKRRTFVLGLCITIDSIVYLTERLLLGSGVNGVKLTYFLTYKLSQDQIETLFSVIRRRGGWNNNPTTLQFSYAYRALLSHIGVVASRSCNVFVDGSNDILSGQENEEVDPVFVNNLLNEHSYATWLPMLSSYVENVCCYIAGFVVRRLLPRLKCSECRGLLVDPAGSTSCFFLQLKDNGGLVKPSEGVITVIQTAEKYLRSYIPKDQPVHAISRLGMKIEHSVLLGLDCSKVFGDTSHMLDSGEGIENHVISLIRQVVRFFLDIRKFHIAKCWNNNQKGTVVRQSMTKLVLFKNQ